MREGRQDIKGIHFLFALRSPRVPVRVLQRNYDETVVVQTPGGSVTVGKSAASRVWVRPKNASEPRRSKIK